ncbi:succinate dehydrogenase assembly factor 2 [Thiomonas sp.]|jgi:antitoxin CptB|uniref:FAD assembly factor SdhE n=1 Tax=Thiomonas sp. TaxID=2047785 RepID=UPI00262797ED|nr:succinate dehydrogenase assembly factor 2 [Thiomonas sp.]
MPQTPVPAAAAEVADAASMSRLRWRARRGMLENDLILQRYFAQCETPLRTETLAALNDLLALDDNTLFDLFSRKIPLPEQLDRAAVRQVLDALQHV